MEDGVFMLKNLFKSNGRPQDYEILTVEDTAEAESSLSQVLSGRRVLVLTDENIAPLYLDSFAALISKLSAGVESFVIPAGERSKGFPALQAVLEKLISLEMTRSDFIAVLGGGVIGDIGGFAASCYMRGMNYINIPTTLLSMVDSSVGGKTGIDIGGIKNAAGSFYQPRLVVAAVNYLDTLPAREFSSGIGEIIKYMLIAGPGSFSRYRENKLIGPAVIAECVSIKLDYVCDDTEDMDKRRVLNLGHTFGHAFESASGFRLAHGEAVGLGLAAEACFSEKIGYSERGTHDLVVELLREASLAFDPSPYLQSAADFISHDKKSSGDSVIMPLIKSPGDIRLEKVSLRDILGFIHGEV